MGIDVPRDDDGRSIRSYVALLIVTEILNVDRTDRGGRLHAQLGISRRIERAIERAFGDDVGVAKRSDGGVAV